MSLFGSLLHLKVTLLGSLTPQPPRFLFLLTFPSPLPLQRLQGP